MRLILLMALLSLAVLNASSSSAADYKLGERLPKQNPHKPSHHKKADKNAYQTIEWEDLLPKGWDLVSKFNSLNFDNLADEDPKAMQALEDMKKQWASAPVEPSMDGKRIRISGFMIPLEQQAEQISEFLLAPYFGACIHVPPPPANQLIYVVLAKPIALSESMTDVWVEGTLSTEKMGTDMGQSAYRLAGVSVKPYQAAKKTQMFLNIGGMTQRLPTKR